jgi:hypothetical protein
LLSSSFTPTESSEIVSVGEVEVSVEEEIPEEESSGSSALSEDEDPVTVIVLSPTIGIEL